MLSHRASTHHSPPPYIPNPHWVLGASVGSILTQKDAFVVHDCHPKAYTPSSLQNPSGTMSDSRATSPFKEASLVPTHLTPTTPFKPQAGVPWPFGWKVYASSAPFHGVNHPSNSGSLCLDPIWNTIEPLALPDATPQGLDLHLLIPLTHPSLRTFVVFILTQMDMFGVHD